MAETLSRQAEPSAPRTRFRISDKIGALGTATWRVALRLFYLLIRDLTPELDPRILDGRFGALCTEPPLVVLKGLDTLADYHLMVISAKESPSKFNDVFRSVPSSVRGLVTILEREIGRLTSLEPSSVRNWRQILTFLLRPDYPTEREDHDFIQDWVDQELMLAESIPETLGLELQSAFVTNTSDMFEEHVFTYFSPTHGPGAVALDPTKHKTRKISQLDKDSYLVNCPLMRDWIPEAYLTPELPIADNPVPWSSVLEVPKSWKKRRVIAVESTTRMYVQKGIQRGLYCAIKLEPFWSQHIDFHDATKSHSLTRTGSRSGRYATLDLSAASDSVTVAHVEHMLGGHKTEKLLERLLDARSQRAIIPSKKTIRLKTFATMGNAFCFPIETLVFACVCVAAIERCGGDVAKSHFRVYGDDIIIETEYASACSELLGELGFKVNSEKSFLQGPFRESCGIECYHGLDITPLRLSRKFCTVNYDSTVEATMSWVDLANEAYLRGFFLLSRELRHELVTVQRRAIPFTPDGSVGLIGSNNSHLVGQWNSHLSAMTWVYPTRVPRTASRKIEGLPLFEWLSSAQSREILPDDDSFGNPWDRHLPASSSCSVPSARISCLEKSRSANGQVRDRLGILSYAWI